MNNYNITLFDCNFMENKIGAAHSVKVMIKLVPSKYIYTLLQNIS